MQRDIVRILINKDACVCTPCPTNHAVNRIHSVQCIARQEEIAGAINDDTLAILRVCFQKVSEESSIFHMLDGQDDDICGRTACRHLGSPPT